MIILVRVNTPEDADFSVDWAVVKVTDEFQATLRARREALLHPTKPYLLSYWDTTAEFVCPEELLDQMDEDSGVEAPEWDDRVGEAENFSVDKITNKDVAGASMLQVDVERLILSEHGVWWRAHVRHTDVFVETTPLPWEVLLP
jgi:hypothetical protein